MSGVNEIGRTIKSARKKSGYSQVKLAEQAEIDLRHLQRLEAGEVDCRLSTLMKIASALGISLSHLLGQFEQASDQTEHLLNELVLNQTASDWSVMETLTVAVQVCNTDGLITYSNSAHAKITHFNTPNDIINKVHIWDMAYDAKDGESMKTYLKHLVEDQPSPTPYDAFNTSKEGKPIPVRVLWNYLKDRNGNVIGFISTILER